tara:strand:- start:1662 stop:1949 length:288 start_codon:yes stop_codon:yes gene_type:complete
MNPVYMDELRQALLSDLFADEMSLAVQRAVMNGLSLVHPEGPHEWRIRVNRAGNLEIVSWDDNRTQQVVFTLTRAGALTHTGAIASGAAAAAPGR